MTARTWIDVSVPIRHGMVHWPGDPAIEIERVTDVARGDDATVSRIDAGVHSGTHVDAPAHFILDGIGVDAIDLRRLLGEARVVAIEGPAINLPALRALDPQEGERLLFKTRNSPHAWQTGAFAPDYVYLTLEGARFLAERRVGAVGIDYLSIASMDEGPPTHKALLAADVCIIEGLDLSAVEPGLHEMICLPLRIEGADGAPARVLLRRLEPAR